MPGYGSYIQGAAKRMAQAEQDKMRNTVVTEDMFEAYKKQQKAKEAREVEKKIIDLDSIIVQNITTKGILTLTQFTNASLATSNLGAGNFIVLNGTNQGNSASTRIGNAVSLVSIQIRYSLMSAATTVTTNVPINCRVLVLYDSQTNGAFPNWNGGSSATFSASDVTNFMTNDGIGTTASHDNPAGVTSMRNNFNIARFKTLYDKLVVLNNNAVGPNGFCDNIYLNLRGKNVYWKNTGTSTLISDIDKGSILFGVATDSVSGGSVGPTLYLSSRIRFTDD